MGTPKKNHFENKLLSKIMRMLINNKLKLLAYNLVTNSRLIKKTTKKNKALKSKTHEKELASSKSVVQFNRNDLNERSILEGL